MVTFNKLTSMLLFAAFALVAMAAPHHSDKTMNEVIHRRGVLATPTRHAMASACTNGLPASKQHPAAYPINDYTVITPDDSNWTSYALNQDWYGEHFISGPHVMTFTHNSDPYGPFKCQYTCNADASCSAYFAWYENVGTDHEHLNCVLFNAVIPPSVFIETNGTIASGAYDKLCDRSS